MSDTISDRNGIELKIGKDWDYCIDKFGLSFTHECANTYREHIRQVINEKISFMEWCRLSRNNSEPTDRTCEDMIVFHKGSRVRLIRYGGKQELPLGIKGYVRGITKNGEMLVTFDNKRRAKLKTERDLCIQIQETDDVVLTDAELIDENLVLHKYPSVCMSCGRLLYPGTHFRDMVFNHKGQRHHIEMCSPCVRYIRKHKLSYDRNGLREIFTTEA